jgi:hypothetical protein
MTSTHDVHAVPAAEPDGPLRWGLKPSGPVTGHVDGAWWPRSADLTAELPALAEVLVERLGQVHRVAYGLSSWDPSPRRLDVDGFRVRLEGFTYQDQNVVHLTGRNRDRISLLVIPPETDQAAGRDTLRAATDQDNVDRPEVLLAASTPA